MKRRKKRFVLPLCLLLLLSLCAPAYAAADAPFADIHGHWAECQMTWAQETGILTGTSSTTLSPDDTATRAMAVTVLYRYAGSPAVEGTSGFADVPADAYYADGVAWCVQAGLITGKTETAFRPGDPMTREEFAATLYRLLVDRHGVPEQVGENNVTTLADFADAQSVSAFAQDAMAWAVGDLFLSGFRQEGDARELLPQGPITRGEMIHLLRQYDCLVEGNPAQLYRLSPEDVRSIRLQQGSGPQAMITDPAEIQRFLEKVNAFTYTAQENPRPAGGFYFFADLHLTDGTSVCLLLSQNGIDHHYTEPASEGDAYFPLDWMESFGLRK